MRLIEITPEKDGNPPQYKCSDCGKQGTAGFYEGVEQCYWCYNSRSDPVRMQPIWKFYYSDGTPIPQSNGSGADQPGNHSRSSDGVVGDKGNAKPKKFTMPDTEADSGGFVE